MPSAGAITAGKAYVIISAIDRTKHILGTVTRNVNAAATKMQAIGSRLTFGAGLATMATALPIQQFGRFEDAMLAVRAKMGATSGEYQRMTQLAQHLGETTSFTAQQVAEAMVVMAQMGLKADEVTDSIQGILSGARATGTELPAMADYVLTAVRAFGSDFSEASDYADVLTAACNNSALSMDDLGQALQYASSSGQLAGSNIREVTTLLAALANMGVRGTMAGTSLRRIYEKLAMEKEKLAAIGVNPFDDQGNYRPIVQIITDLARAIQDLPQGEKIALLTDIFEVRGMTGAAKLTQENFSQLAAAIENCQGVAQETAAMMDTGVGGAFRFVTSAVERCGLAIGEAFRGAIVGARDDIIGLVQSTTEWINTHQQTVVMTAVGIAAMGVLGATFLTTGLAIRVTAAALGGFHFILAGLLAAFRALTFTMRLLPLSLTAVTGAFHLAIGATTGFYTAAKAACTATVAALNTVYGVILRIPAALRVVGVAYQGLVALCHGLLIGLSTVLQATAIGLKAVVLGTIFTIRAAFLISYGIIKGLILAFPAIIQLVCAAAKVVYYGTLVGFQAVTAATMTTIGAIVNGLPLVWGAVCAATAAVYHAALTTMLAATLAWCLAVRGVIYGIPAAFTVIKTAIMAIPAMLSSGLAAIPAFLASMTAANLAAVGLIAGAVALLIAFWPEILAGVQWVGQGIAEVFGSVFQYIVNICTQMGQAVWTTLSKAFGDTWSGIKTAATDLWGSLTTDCMSAFGTISAQISEGDWTGAFETAVLAMRAVWSDFQTFFITAWHTTAMAFMDIWMGLRRGIQSAREAMAKLIGWFMKLGMTEEQKADFDKALDDVQKADRAAMESGFTASKTKHEKAIADAQQSNVTIRGELAKHTMTKDAEIKAKREQQQAEEATRDAQIESEREAAAQNLQSQTLEGYTPPEPPAALAGVTSQVASQMRFTAEILQAAQRGTAEAEKHFLENKAERRNALIEQANNKERDKNAEATAKNTARLVELAEDREDKEEEVVY